MYTLLKSLQIRKELIKRGIKMFSIEDFKRVFDLPKYKVKYFLEKESDGGVLLRLKRGLYCLTTDMPAEEEIANRLYKPSYISFEYALSNYSILPEMTYSVSCATTKSTRNFEVQGKNFVYYKIKRRAYTGYGLVNRQGKSFLMAEAEKAVVDYLYFVALGKKSVNERLNTTSLDKGKLLDYGRLFQRDKLMDLISELK